MSDKSKKKAETSECRLLTKAEAEEVNRQSKKRSAVGLAMQVDGMPGKSACVHGELDGIPVLLRVELDSGYADMNDGKMLARLVQVTVMRVDQFPR